MRVLHLIKSLGRGGAEMLLPEGLRFADRSRFEFRYAYFLPWKDALVPALVDQGAPVDCLAASGNARILMSARRVARYIREHGIELVHCHLPVAGAVGRLAGRMTGVPVIYTEHNKQERYHPWTRALNRLTWRWQELVIAVSDDVANSIAQHMGSHVPVEVVLNGVDLDRFRRDPAAGAAVREELGIEPDSPVVGTVAVFRAQKRLEDWLAAAARIRERLPDARFVLVGDGPLRSEIEARARTRGLDDIVFFAGLREDVRPYLSAMDVYMMSSEFEGLPVALLEAMSMECTPVCTAVGGIPQAVHDGRNGYLVPPRRPGDLAEGVIRVLAMPDLGRAMGAAARDIVRQSFDMRAMARSLEGIYDRIARQPVDQRVPARQEAS